MRETWRSARFDRLGAGVYDFVVERERLARPLGRLMWGTDLDRFYDALRVIGEMPDAAAILDLPCGGGVAFRALRPEQDYRRPVPVLLVYGQRDHLGDIALSTRAWTHPFAGRGCGA